MSPSTQENVDDGYITIEQWEKMSRKQREAAGLPTRKVGIMQIVRGGLIKLPTSEKETKPTVKTDSAKFEETMGVSVEKLEELGIKAKRR